MYGWNKLVSPQKSVKKVVEESDKTKPRFVALDLGPIGEMLEPIGNLSFEKVYEIESNSGYTMQNSSLSISIFDGVCEFYLRNKNHFILFLQ